MLKGLPTAISPELMSVLMKMGHGDRRAEKMLLPETRKESDHE